MQTYLAQHLDDILEGFLYIVDQPTIVVCRLLTGAQISGALELLFQQFSIFNLKLSIINFKLLDLILLGFNNIIQVLRLLGLLVRFGLR